MSRWSLEGDFSQCGNNKLFDITSLPLILGRDDSLECTVSLSSVSRRHACIELNDHESLLIEDLDSSNGTYVNREAIEEPTAIRHGDIIHLGDAELRLIDRSNMRSSARLAEVTDSGATAVMSVVELNKNLPSGVLEIEELIDKKLIHMVYQPIVTPKGKSIIGFEILGRGTHPNLTQNPAMLFDIAESVGLETILSQLMREEGIRSAVQHGLPGTLLVNTHPKELEDLDGLLGALAHMRKTFPSTPLMCEIHENAVAGLDQVTILKRELAAINIQLAFDDFGVGQSRLMEIAGAKPDLVKFDRALIDRIDKSDASRVSLLRNLKMMVSELGITTLAECVSNEGEYLTCDQIGFDLYQGYYFGKPAAPETFKKN